MIARVAIIGGVLIFMGLCVWMYGESRYREGAARATIKIIDSAEEAKDEKKKNIRKIRNLNDVDLVSRYCEWVLYPYDKCIREYRIAD